MNQRPAAWTRLIGLCRGDQAVTTAWLAEPDWRSLGLCVATITFGCALYGGVVGLWRGPEQAVFTAVKMPLLIFLTAAGNALLNGLLAQVLGSGLGFRQSAIAILLSFTIAAVILAALSPIAWFILLNAPPLESAGRTVGHSITLLADVLFIAYAGVVANRRLASLLHAVCASPAAARRVFWSWLAGNLFLGAQLSWVLRPFIGSPGLAVEFLRPDPMRGNFYEAVGRAVYRLLF